MILNSRNGNEGTEEVRGKVRDWTLVLTLV